MAVLLGSGGGAQVSRFERLARHPNLEIAFACQAIFGVSAHEIFPGIYQKVEQEVIARAEANALHFDRSKSKYENEDNDSNIFGLDMFTSMQEFGHAQYV